jgi:hypothetical protein
LYSGKTYVLIQHINPAPVDGKEEVNMPATVTFIPPVYLP